MEQRNPHEFVQADGSLPVTVKEDAVETIYEKGLLKIVILKAEAKSTSKVKIQIKGK